MPRTLASLIAALLALPLVAAIAADHTPSVQTQDGPVRGTRANGIDSYLGIPYAKAPVGELRWHSPEPATHWKKPLDADHFGANCYQSAPQGFGPYTSEFLISLPVSENCLFLNIWAPAQHDKPLPVYFFIHGGGFGSGSGSIPIYNGADLAARGVVVVNVNYRLGVFGYLAHPQLTAQSKQHSSGNYGLEDLIAALHWVHANIARFGGDPRLVTISGQSAGAMAVNDLLVSQPARGLFAHAIAESGSGMGVASPTLHEAEANGVQFASLAGASDIHALRALSAERLQMLADVPPPKQGQSSSVARIRFAPNLDGRIISVPPEASSAPASNVPLLTGFNADEGALFGAGGRSIATFEADVHQGYADFADRVLSLYPHTTDAQAAESAALLARDRYMTSLVIFSETRSRSQHEVVYNYLFDHPYPGPDAAKFRTFHTAEVPYVFGALEQQGRQFDAQDHQVSRQLQNYWVNFMRSGDPNGQGLPHWPRAGEKSGDVMGLGDHPGERGAVSSPERLALLREYAASGHALSLF